MIHSLKTESDLVFLFTDDPLLMKGADESYVLFDKSEINSSKLDEEYHLFSELLENTMAAQ